MLINIYTFIRKLLALLTIKINLARPILSQHLIIRLARKRRLARHHNMTNDAQTKQIADGIALRLQILNIHYFRRHIPRRPTPHKQVLGLVCPGRQAEIRDNAVEVVVLPKEDVFGFEVAVHYAFAVHVLEAHEEALEDAGDLLAGEFLFGFEFVVELAALQEFNAYVDGVLGFVDFVDFHEVLMVEFPHKFDLID